MISTDPVYSFFLSTNRMKIAFEFLWDYLNNRFPLDFLEIYLFSKTW